MAAKETGSWTVHSVKPSNNLCESLLESVPGPLARLTRERSVTEPVANSVRERCAAALPVCKCVQSTAPPYGRLSVRSLSVFGAMIVLLVHLICSGLAVIDRVLVSVLLALVLDLVLHTAEVCSQLAHGNPDPVFGNSSIILHTL